MTTHYRIVHEPCEEYACCPGNFWIEEFGHCIGELFVSKILNFNSTLIIIIRALAYTLWI